MVLDLEVQIPPRLPLRILSDSWSLEPVLIRISVLLTTNPRPPSPNTPFESERRLELDGFLQF